MFCWASAVHASCRAHSFSRVPSTNRRATTILTVALVLAIGSLCFAPSAEATISAGERAALIDLYNSTNGAGWTNSTNWLGGIGTECTWYGVFCQGPDSFVYRITLSGNNLSGPIPSSIDAFAGAAYIQLNNNQLSGSLPASLGNLTSLYDLTLQGNQLTGSIPSQFSAMAGLRILQLQGNGLSGPIPAFLGSMGLQTLYLYSNAFTGPIPAELGQMTSLVDLGLDSNSLTGTIPPELGSLTNLQHLRLQSNQLTGAIPSELGSLSSLQSLLLRSNQLTGAIPSSLSSLSSVNALQLGYNALYPGDAGVGTWATSREPGWDATQTVAPTNVSVTGTTTSSATLSWTPIAYTGNSGRYEVWRSTGGASVFAASSANKSATGLTISGLSSGVAYTFTVRTITDSNVNNPQNSVTSEFSAGVLGTTAVPSISISDVSVPETNTGSTNATFTITLSATSGSPVTVQYATADGTATAGSDYTAAAPTTLTFNPGQTSKQATILVTGDTIDEPDETFTVTLSSPSGATILDAQGVGTIVDDDCTLTVNGSAPSAAAVGEAVAFSASLALNTCIGAVTYNWGFGDGSISASQNTTHTYASPGTYEWTLSASASGIVSTTGGTIAISGPPNVVVLSNPKPMLQPADQPGATTQFAVTNIGGAATTVTLARQGDFFTQTPESFSLGAAETKTVSVTALARPIGSYSGASSVSGQGVPAALSVPIQLVTYGPPGESLPDIVPLQVRVDYSGSGNSLSGSAQFKNIGTSASTGVVASDEVWLVPQTGVATIAPGEVITVQFVANRLLLPNPSSVSSSITTLRFVYPPAPGSTSRSTTSSGGGSAGVAVTVSFGQPEPKGLPAVPPGQLGLTLGGLDRSGAFPARVVSDLRLTSALGTSVPPIDFYFVDLFKPATEAISVTQTGQPGGGLSLAAPAGAASGGFSAHLRGSGLTDVSVNATLLRINDGTRELFQLEIPRLRSNRGAGPGERVGLPGLAFLQSNSCRLVLQEVSGAAASARVSILDAAGVKLLGLPVRALRPFEAGEEQLTIPSGAATILVENSAASGRLMAFAVENGAGDGIVIHDPRYDEGASQGTWVVPYVTGGKASGRKRPIRRSSGTASEAPHAEPLASAADASASRRTAFSLYNPGATESRVRLEFWTSAGTMAAQKEVSQPAGSTREYDDVLAELGVYGTGAEQLRITLLSGAAVPAAFRLGTGSTDKAVISNLPVIDSLGAIGTAAAVALGPFDDASIESKRGGVPSAFTPTLGLVETSGASVDVEVSVSYSSVRDAALGTKGKKTFTLGPNQTLLVANLVRSIVGASRDASGDFHDVTLKFRRLAGNGRFIPFVVSESVATGDAIVILR